MWKEIVLSLIAIFGEIVTYHMFFQFWQNLLTPKLPKMEPDHTCYWSQNVVLIFKVC